MERYIFNGEPYIKLSPTIKEEYQITKPGFPIMDVSTNLEVTINSVQDLKYLTPFTFDLLIRLGVITKIPIEEHDDIGFYQIYCNEDSFVLVGRETKKILSRQSLKEVDEKFISLAEFMNKAVYIGREHMSPKDSNIELLYQYQDLYILKVPGKEAYIVMNRNNPLLANYKIGEILPHYYDKESLYKSILKQHLGINKNEGPQR